MAQQFYQNWAETLTVPTDAVAVGLSLTLTDAGGQFWGDGAGFVKNFSPMQSGQIQLLLYDGWKTFESYADVPKVGIGIVFPETISLIDTLFYRDGATRAGGNHGSHVAEGENLAINQLDVVLQQFNGAYALSFADILNQWLDFQPGTVDSSQISYAGCAEYLTDTVSLSDASWFFVPQKGDTLTLSDAFGLGLGVRDTLTISDAVKFGYGYFDTLTLSDVFKSNFLQSALSDQLTLTDSSSLHLNILTLALSDQLALLDIEGYGQEPYGQAPYGTFKSLFQYQLGLAGALSLSPLSDSLSMLDSVVDFLLKPSNVSVSDQEGANWNDAIKVAASFLLGLAEQLVLSDLSDYGTGPYGKIPFGGFVQGDLLGYGNLITDSLTLSDALSFSSGYGRLQAETLSLSDALGIGFGFAETLSLSDAGFSYNAGSSALTESPTDTLTMSDADIEMELGGSFIYELLALLGTVTVAGGTVGTDDLPFADAFVMSVGLQISETLSLTELLGLGWAVSDTLTLSDAMVLGFGFADTLSLSDLTIVSYGYLPTDSLTLSDAFGTGLGFSETLTLSEAVTSTYGYKIAETLTLSELIGLGLGVSDTLTLSDSLSVLGYGYLPTDTLTLSEVFSLAITSLVISDTLTLSDLLVYGTSGGGIETVSDTMSLSDAMVWFYPTFAITDSLTLSDAISASFGLQITDTISLSEALMAGYGIQLSEQISLSDVSGYGYGNLVSDQIVLSDAMSYNAGLPGLTETLSDTISLTDAAAWFPAIVARETLTLSDAFGFGFGFAETFSMSDASAYQVGILITDSLTLSDQLGLGFGFAEQLTESDALVSLVSVVKALTDSLTLSDQLGLGFGFAEQLTLTDAGIIRYGYQFADQVTTWLDQISEGFSGGGVQQLVDSLTLSDQLLLTLGFRISESLTLTEAVTVAKLRPLAKQFSDQIFLNDVSGYGFEPYGQAPYGGFVQNGELLGYGNLVADSLVLSTDVIDYYLSSATALQLALIDGWNLTDSLGANFQIVGPQLNLAETLQLLDKGTATDLFSGASLGPNWTVNTGSFAEGGGVGSISGVGGDGRANVWWDANTFDADQRVSCTIPTLGSGTGALGVAVRMSATGETYYCLYETSTSWYLFKMLFGSLILLNSGAHTAVVGDLLDLDIEGSQLTARINGAIVTSLSDSDITFGQPGMAGVDVAPTSNTIDNWTAIGVVVGMRIGYGDRIADNLTLVDSFVFAGPVTVIPLQMADLFSLTDTLTAMMVLIPSIFETITLSDQLELGFSIGLVDQLVLSDLIATAAIQVTEQGTDQLVLAEAVQFFMPLSATETDVLLLADRLNFGIGLPFFADQLTQIDTFQTSFGLSIAEQLTLVEAVGIFIPFPQQGDVMTLTDAFASLLGYGTLATDQGDQITQTDQFGYILFQTWILKQLTDTLTIGELLGIQYGEIFTDTLSVSDALAVSVLQVEVLSDTETLSDQIGTGYGLGTTDQLSLSDATGFLFPVGLGIGESFTVVDAPIFGIGLITADTASLSDVLAIGSGQAVTDTLSLSDLLRIGYGDNPADQLTQTDQVNFAFVGGMISEVTSDIVTTWLDALSGFGYGYGFIDQLSLTDQIGVGSGNRLTDQISLTDLLQSIYGLNEVLSDTETVAWTDALVKSLTGALGPTDTLTQTEALLIGIGNQFVEQLLLTDSPVIGFSNIFVDSANNWLDLFQPVVGLPFLLLVVNDQMTQADATKAGYGQGTSDTNAMSDQMALLESFQMALADAPPQILDALQELFSYGLAIGDAVLFQEQLVILYGLMIQDGVTQIDQLDMNLIYAAGLLLSDDESANWFDPVLLTLIFAPREITMASLSVLSEMVVSAIEVQGEQTVSSIGVS